MDSGSTAAVSPDDGVMDVVIVLGCSSSFACSLAKSRPNSATAVFSFCRTGVVPVRARGVRDPVVRRLRLRPNGPLSSGWRALRAELELVSLGTSQNSTGETYSA
jgi:hypothetical protein